jgi:hypothetical protein
VSWKWSGEGRRNSMRSAIRAGVKRVVWHCRACGRGQVGGKHSLGYGLAVRKCRYCGREQPFGT